MKFYTKFTIANLDFVLVKEADYLINITVNNELDLKLIKRNDLIFQEEVKQIKEYFNQTRFNFTFKVKFIGTDFQKQVWKATSQIPYGTIASYQDIARKINNPKASRAVGNALNKNPLLLFVPCHRVIASNFTFGGFTIGLDLKKQLLNLEKK